MIDNKLLLVAAVAAILLPAAVRAQGPVSSPEASPENANSEAADPAVLEMAGSLPLTTKLLDSLEKFVKGLKSDRAAKQEWDTFMQGGNGDVDDPKFTKLAALFKSAKLAPEDLSKASLAMSGTALAGQMADAGKDIGTDKTVAANIAFVRANKDRVLAYMTAFGRLANPPASSPAASP